MRLAIFMTGKGSDYCLLNFGNYSDLFRELLQEPGVSFDTFDSKLQEYPSDYAGYEAVIITGSACDARGPGAWIRRLEEGIREAYQANLKILGVCFGHHAVANALGGQTGRNAAGWELGIHQLVLEPAFHEQHYVNDIPLPLHILQVHQDHVIKAPPGATSEYLLTKPTK